MRKALLLITLFALAIVLCACGAKEEALVSMYDLQQTMMQADDSLPDMKTVNSSAEDADELFEYLSDMPYDKVEGYFLAYSSEGKADEIAVIAVKNSADINEAVDSLREHQDGRVKLYTQYDPTQTGRAEDGLVFSNGRYAALIISDNQQAVKAAFEEFLAK
ncbi:MAG: DUF4358 domain-containing protein [Oscillospiraceae bacterium]|nr:DUF4358 domain-containing protein [Oscillospiraceae bacterium]